MDSQVTAAVIAAGVSGLTLVGTLAAQYFGRRATSKQLDRTLGEQRTRTLNERFATAAGQLGSERPAVRLAGVYAMAGLADDWEENRQPCVDVLCAYLRMPYERNPGKGAPEPELLAFEANREVRHTVIRVITQHLKRDAKIPWQCLNFDFTGVVFDGGDFASARFSSGKVIFRDTRFRDGEVHFNAAEFSGAEVDFTGAHFSGGTVHFRNAQFSGSTLDFGLTQFTKGEVDFDDSRFSAGTILFRDAKFSGTKISFQSARFSGGLILFRRAEFSGSTVDFGLARFIGGVVRLEEAEFTGGTVDFSRVDEWSSPPALPLGDAPPIGVSLPGA
jgi:uncharacterized protein YjbI with pentapeptide repeats